ncbi:MAG: tetratricopeptide repeat protein, partial [Calditrichaeota bacterium]
IAKAFSEITDKFRQSQANLAEQERLQKEMQLAQDIQQTLLPPFVPEIEGYEIASLYQAAKEVGGDYYDFVEVDKDSLGIVVADVSGKGVPGSLIMTMIRTALRTEARGVKSASEVLARLNQFVVKDMKKGMFVTIFYVIIDSKRRRLNYASAGHNPMILYRPSTQKTYYLNPKGFPVGISLPDPELFKKSIESDTIQLVEDDVLLIYTDGITEAMNRKRHLFGEERLLDAVKKYSNLRVKPFTEKLREEIYSFTQGFEQNDDITLVAIKEKSTPEKIELHRAQKAHRLILDGMSIREACQEAGITTYAYYNKYKKIFEEEGLEAYEIDETISVEAKHLSIEEKTKIYDIIKKHPEYGAKRISEELNTERYDFTVINESRVYDELVRSRLNTRQLREAYVSRAGKKKRMKPPGTPMMTLDGRVILDRQQYEMEEEPEEEPVVPETTQPKAPEREVMASQGEKELDDDFYIESLMAMPIEDLLNKNRDQADFLSPVESETEEKEPLRSPYIEDEEPPASENQAVFTEESAPSSRDFFFTANGEDDLEEIESGIDFVDSSPVDEDIAESVEDESPSSADTDEAFSLVDEQPSFRGMWDESVSEIEGGEDLDEIDLVDIDNELETVQDEPGEETPEAVAESPQSSDDELGDIFEDEIGFESLMETGTVSIASIATETDSTSEMDDDTADEQLSVSDDAAYPSLDIKENLNSLESELATSTELPAASIAPSNDRDQSEETISFHDLLSEIERDISLLDEASQPGNGKKLAAEIDDAETEPEPENGTASGSEEPYIPIDDDRLILGLKYYKEKRYDDAIREFETLVAANPRLKEIHSLLGNAYFRSGLQDKALEAYQRVIELDPRDVDAYENIGVIYANQGDYERAISEWKRLLEIDPAREDIIDNMERARLIIEKDNISV